jgi:predicted phosphodiesterase
MSTDLPEASGRGLFFIGDPHVAGSPPGQRLEGYQGQVLDKIAACLDRAAELGMVPFFLGDLFHWPRDNPNSLLVELIALFGRHRPFVLVGNHDKYQTRFTPDVSLAVLQAAGVVRVLEEAGPAFVLNTPEGRALVGGSPDGTPLPSEFARQEGDFAWVVWTSHHGVAFPEFQERRVRVKEIPGVDYLVNGHIHRPQESIRVGSTLWCNPGNLTRLTFTRRSQQRQPAAAVWTPGCEDLEKWVAPHLPFEQVFPDQEFPSEEAEASGSSRFLDGLERLAWRRTREGSGLKQFLQANLNPELPESRLIWELYEEATREQ